MKKILLLAGCAAAMVLGMVRLDAYAANGTVPAVAAWYQSVITSNIGQSDASMTLASALTTPGGSLPNGYWGFILDSQNPARRETIECYLNGTSLTGCIRGLSSTNPDVAFASTTYAFPHNVGASIIVSDYSFLGHVQQILQGSDTFPNALSYPNTSTPMLFTQPYQIPSKGYVDSVASSGAPDATQSQKGLVQIATNAQIASGTASSTDGSQVLWYAVSPQWMGTFVKQSSTANGVPLANASGTISPGYLPFTYSGWAQIGASPAVTCGASSNYAIISSTTITTGNSNLLILDSGSGGGSAFGATTKVVVDSTSTPTIAVGNASVLPYYINYIMPVASGTHTVSLECNNASDEVQSNMMSLQELF